MTQNEQVAFISLERSLDHNRRKNLHITVGLLNFIWMVFHFAVVFFFVLQLKSILMVGIFLGIGNLFAFLLDIPIGILQYYLKSKTLYILGAISQMLALLIFANFIFKVTDFLTMPIVENAGLLQSVLGFFLFDGLNIILLILACFFYGFTKEINELTTISYVLNNANPSQYKTIIAKNNLFFGIGGLFGLILSGLILTFSPKLIIFSILFIILFILFVTNKLFDNSVYTLKFSDLEKFKIFFNKNSIGEIKNNIVNNVSKLDLKSTIGKTKYIFLRPLVIEKNMITVDEMVTKTRESFNNIYSTFKYALNNNVMVYWAFSMVLTFGFWDTFASTFLIDFLNQLKPGYSYVLLGIIAIPAFGLQDFFGKLADKIGVYTVANAGLIISGLSLIFMGFFAGDLTLSVMMILALVNSIGYAMCMSLSVATFLEAYNKSYAENMNLIEIDSNASATPIKILQNLANVIGLFLGGLILSIFSYSVFFFLFGTLIICFLIWSLKNKKEIVN